VADRRGRRRRSGQLRPPAPLIVDARDGALARRGSPAYDALDRERRRRAEGETWRSLYVALSRPREVLLVTGSQGRPPPGPWLRAFHLLGVGPQVVRDGGAGSGGGSAGSGGGVARALGLEVEQHPLAPAVRRSGAAAPAAARASAAPWAGRVPRPAAFPPVVSPSWVALEGVGRAAEPRVRAPWPAPLLPADADDDDRRPTDPDDGERLAGRGTAIGTLVHDALARGRRLETAADLDDLAGQEVLFPFPAAARVDILAEVGELVAGFWSLVDAGTLPAPGAAVEEHVELPFAFEAGGSTWQGVIDRLVRAGGVWCVDDYKTDRRLDPDRYAFPLATYVRAVELVRGVRPLARLVDLRRREVVVVPDAALRAAWRERVGA
jgi:ATP-dependent exoDNAse (exonuclease V) beta subunit